MSGIAEVLLNLGFTVSGSDLHSSAVTERLESLGATFYAMLTGSPPFSATDPMELIHNHITRIPGAPHVANAEVPTVLFMVMQPSAFLSISGRCTS